MVSLRISSLMPMPAVAPAAAIPADEGAWQRKRTKIDLYQLGIGGKTPRSTCLPMNSSLVDAGAQRDLGGSVRAGLPRLAGAVLHRACIDALTCRWDPHPVRASSSSWAADTTRCRSPRRSRFSGRMRAAASMAARRACGPASVAPDAWGMCNEHRACRDGHRQSR